MRFLLILAVSALSILAVRPLQAAPTGSSARETIRGWIDSAVNAQWGGGYYGDESDDVGYGRGSRGSTAQPLNFRVAAYFTAIPIMNTDISDASGSEPWTEYWSTGLGGGLDVGYQFVPGFRLTFGSGYHVFTGQEDDSGPWTVEWDSIQAIPIRLEAALCFPFETPSGSWFQGNRGFVKGPVPYIAIEIAGVYRMETGAEVDMGLLGTADADFMEASFTFALGARVGFEFRGDNFGFFVDFGYRMYTPPEEADGVTSDILEMHTIPIRAGFALYFSGGSGGGY